jgi:ferredoxin
MQNLLCNTTQFQSLLDILINAGYRLFGPTIRNNAIIYDEIRSAQDLPIGWTDEQEAGYYRIKQRDDQAYFGYNLGQQSWKQYLFPPQEKLWSVSKTGSKLQILKEMPNQEKMAFIGVRSCELHAIFVQDKVFNHRLAIYEQYQQRRENTFILALNCTTVARTCFCASMNTGPLIKEGYDLALTEIMDSERHDFIISIGSALGESICKPLALPTASQADIDCALNLVEGTKNQMIRQVDNAHIHEVLNNSWNSSRWDEVAQRCINCANCTLVCPTCFCSNHEDKVSLDDTHIERWQSWDSCFNLSHSYIHGGSIRTSAQSRYRQWLTHKFGTWWDQFGVSGCVGCGRCIAWCPVGIDVTEELNHLQLEYDEKNS